MTDAATVLSQGALATAGAIRAGTISARAVIETTLARIAAENDRLHAFIAVMAEEARAEADMLDAVQARGQIRGPLHGVPVGVKDIIDVAGQKTRAGSITRDHLPAASADAWCVTRLRAAGAIVVGKTHTVEYAFGGWGTNPIAGTPVNPHDRTTPRNPGGSSSGTGVAVAAGLIPIGFGTDTGGSVRLPASWCGTVGHKTSMGLISRAGVVPLALHFDTIGPLARTVADAALMSQVMLGSDPADASTTGAPGLDLLSGLEAGVAGLTLGVVELDASVAVDPEVAAAVAATHAALEKAGARLVSVRLPETLATYTTDCGELMMVEGAHTHGALARENPLRLSPWAAKRIGGGFDVPATRYFAGIETRRVRTAAVNAMMAEGGIDALVLPTTPIAAQPLAAIDEAGLPGILTRFVNYFEWCGVSVPVGKTAAGLPIGYQVVTPRHCDARALRIARAAEAAAGGPLPLPA